MVQAARSGKQNIVEGSADGVTAPYFNKWTSEEMCNIGISLCRMVDKMLMTYQKKKENEFIKNGGIKERMTAARLKIPEKQVIKNVSLSHNYEKCRNPYSK